MRQRAIVHWLPSGESKRWTPTTLDKLSKFEEFLEERLANSPELLGLESRRTGIRGPFQTFRQVSMKTPSDRPIYPDIVMFCASGHVVVVEVKRSVNPELKDRAVIAQIVDYASSFAAMSEQQCAEVFTNDNAASWTDFVLSMFPDDPDADELADVLLARMQRGELNLVIACDKIPAGLPDVVSGIVSQSSLGFDLDLVEVVPYVREVSEDAEILFVPSIRVSTEIVSRTAVTVMYREGDAIPSTTVQTTSLEDIEEQIHAAGRQADPNVRTWTAEEVEQEFRDEREPVALKLLEFAKEHSADGCYVQSGKRQNAVFGFYVKGCSEGTPKNAWIFSCVSGWNSIGIFLKSAESIVKPETMQEFRRRLKATFGDDINCEQKDAGVQLDVVGRHLSDFLKDLLWFKSEAEAGLDDERSPAES